jgi:hypothetical protein
MLKKLAERKKKTSSISNVFLKMQEKPEKLNLKFALNMFMPRPSCGFFNGKQDASKVYKTATATPKSKPQKKSLKENGCHTAFNSINHSATSTPFDCEPQEHKEKTRSDYKFLYQVGSGGFGRVWKVQEKRSSNVLAMKEISKAK